MTLKIGRSFELELSARFVFVRCGGYDAIYTRLSGLLFGKS